MKASRETYVSDADLTRWRELCEKASEGPWSWAGYVKGPMQLAAKRQFGQTVMAFTRQGMRGAQPQFCDENGLLQKAESLAVREVPYRDDIERIAHPDAEFIAEARTAMPALLDEVNRLRRALEIYGTHIPYCEFLISTEEPFECSCGLEKASWFSA